MPPSIESLLQDSEFRPNLLDRVAVRKSKPPLAVVPADPAWPAVFDVFRARIVAALGPSGYLAINHVGSTSIPDLPAKDVIDIDLVVPSNTDEAAFVPQLEAAGFHFLARESHWHEHRFFCAYEPRSANLHVWGPDCPEVERHRIFRDYLLRHEEERTEYARVKEEAMRATRATGGIVQDYNLRKEETIRGILRRAFKELGYIKDEAK